MTSLTLEYVGQPVDQLALMRHITLHEIAAQYSPWFPTCLADLTGERSLSKYVRFLRGFLAMCPDGITGRTVLDAGCGSGLMSTLGSLMGAREVQGIDCNRGMIETFRAYLGILPYELPVSPPVGDVAGLPHEDETFDLMLSHEAVFHCPDVDASIAEAHRVLRPGGVLLLSDSNHALNRKVREEAREIWRALSLGQPGFACMVIPLTSRSWRSGRASSAISAFKESCHRWMTKRSTCSRNTPQSRPGKHCAERSNTIPQTV